MRSVKALAGDARAEGRRLARQLVSELCTGEAGSVSADSIVIEAHCPDCGSDHGQPRVTAPEAVAGSMWVSVAHSRELVIVAASSRGPIGVDAEFADSSSDFSWLATLLPPGLQSRSASQGRSDDRDLVRRWTRVEAVLKADGRGLRVAPEKVRFDQDSQGIVAHIADEPSVFRVFDLRTEDLQSGDPHSGASLIASAAVLLPRLTRNECPDS